MSLRKHISLGAALGFTTSLLAQSAPPSWQADTPAAQADTNSPAALATRIKAEEIVGSQPIARAYVTCGTNQFAFAVPPGYQADASNPRRITVTSADLSITVTFNLAEQGTGASSEDSADTCREAVLGRYRGAKILSEFSKRAAGHDGPAFDLTWTNPGGSEEAIRLAFVPSRAGVMEFTAKSSPDKFDQSRYALNFLMLSFRSNEHGKLENEIRPFSNKM